MRGVGVILADIFGDISIDVVVNTVIIIVHLIGIGYVLMYVFFRFWYYTETTRTTSYCSNHRRRFLLGANISIEAEKNLPWCGNPAAASAFGCCYNSHLFIVYGIIAAITFVIPHCEA